MADIRVQCMACGHETSISEYVDPDLAACPSCGGKLNIPLAAVSGPRPAAEKKSSAPQRPGVLERTTVTAASAVAMRRARRRQRPKILSWSPGPTALWMLFAVGVIVLSLLRFVVLGDRDRAFFIDAGLVCLGVLHFTVTADAFADSVMHGLLCLTIPFYSLIYLYTVCDSYILRLAVGILVVPFGIDAGKGCLVIGHWLIDMVREHAMPTV